MIFYHYTCGHAIGRVRADGRLLPWPQVVLDGVPLVWLTDLDVPDRAALGLTSKTLSCDRTEWRVTVDADPVRWVRFARRLPTAVRQRLELAPGVLPMHWWVTEVPVPVAAVAPTVGAVAS